MPKTFKLVVIVFVIMLTGGLLLAASGTKVASAADFRSGKPSVAKNEVVDNTLFVAGAAVTIEGTVNGDVFCAANTVTISGKVNGDVICAGQNITITGEVTGDVRVAGDTVDLRSVIGGNLTAVGNKLSLNKGASAGDVQMSGDNLLLAGTVRRDASTSGRSVDITGMVSRNLQADTNNLYVGPVGVVNGTTYYSGSKDFDKAPGAQVGEVRHVDSGSQQASKTAEAFTAGLRVIGIIGVAVLGMILVAVAPRLFYSLSEQAIKRPVITLAAGFGVVFVTLAVAGALAFTIIGLLAAGFVMLAWLLMLLLSGPVFAFYLGRLLLARTTDNALLYMLIGLLLLVALSTVQVVGTIVAFAGALFGSGMIVLELVSRWPRPRYSLEPKTPLFVNREHDDLARKKKPKQGDKS